MFLRVSTRAREKCAYPYLYNACTKLIDPRIVRFKQNNFLRCKLSSWKCALPSPTWLMSAFVSSIEDRGVCQVISPTKAGDSTWKIENLIQYPHPLAARVESAIYLVEIAAHPDVDIDRDGDEGSACSKVRWRPGSTDINDIGSIWTSSSLRA